MENFSWTAEPAESDGVGERAFRIRRAGNAIPGVAWYPTKQ